MNVDPADAIESGRELKRLHEQASEVLAALDAIEAAPTFAARHKLAFDLAMNHGEIRAVGLVAEWSADDRSRWLRSLLEGDEAFAFIEGLVARVNRPRLRTALTAAMPGSFPQPDAETWSRYRAHLRAKPDEKIWGDPAGVALRGLWVTPRCTHRTAEAREDRSPFSLKGPTLTKKPRAREQPVEDVLASAEAFALAPKGPHLAFVAGAAGLGKSSFATMLADRLAAHVEVSPLLVRLRDVEPDRPLLGEIERVLAAEGFVFGAGIRAASNVVLLLDGYDELGDSARSAMDVFFLRVRELVRDGCIHAALLTGRDTLLDGDDGALPEGAEVFTLLPFDAPRVRRWCENWERLTGKPFDASRFLVEETDSLRDVASHPLMLYMLALMEASGRSITAENFDDRARVYRTIVEWCCDRHEELRPNDPWKKTHMRRFLRAAGYAAMVRGREVLRFDDVKGAIRALGLEVGDDPARFAAEHTLLAFTHRADDGQSWEFTHRSFGEYLAAEWLASKVSGLIERSSNAFDPEETWRLDASEATREWLAAFGTALLPENVEKYLLWLLRGADPGALKRLRDRLAEVYRSLVEETEAEETIRVARAWGLYPSQVRGWALANLFLMGGVEERFRPEQVHGGRFLAAVNAIRVAVPDRGTLRRIYSRVGLQGIDNLYARDARDWNNLVAPGLDASDCDLGGIELSGAWLSGARFDRSNMTGADLSFAVLGGSSLVETSLRDATLTGITLIRSTLRGADLAGSKLFWGIVLDSDLSRADLRGLEAARTQFVDVNIEDALLPPDIASYASVFQPRKTRPTAPALSAPPRVKKPRR